MILGDGESLLHMSKSPKPKVAASPELLDLIPHYVSGCPLSRCQAGCKRVGTGTESGLTCQSLAGSHREFFAFNI